MNWRPLNIYNNQITNDPPKMKNSEVTQIDRSVSSKYELMGEKTKWNINDYHKHRNHLHNTLTKHHFIFF